MTERVTFGVGFGIGSGTLVVVLAAVFVCCAGTDVDSETVGLVVASFWVEGVEVATGNAAGCAKLPNAKRTPTTMAASAPSEMYVLCITKKSLPKAEIRNTCVVKDVHGFLLGRRMMMAGLVPLNKLGTLPLRHSRRIELHFLSAFSNCGFPRLLLVARDNQPWMRIVCGAEIVASA